MKRLLIFILFPILVNAQANLKTSYKADWLTDYDLAVEKADEAGKNVLVYFTGSDWCPPCKMLKADLFETDEFQSLSQNYVLLYIDIPRNQDLISEGQMKHNKELMYKLNRKGVFPMIKILNPKGKELDEISGYSMNGEIKYHLEVLKKHQ
ncbi:MAG: thioredoxin family protein [Bacteroidota bacterium]